MNPISAQPDLTKAHCNICGGVRSHFIVFEHKEDWREEITDDPRDDITGTDRYELLKCAGCGHVVFRHSATHSQNYDDDGKLKEVITYSPPKQVRKKLSLLSTVAGGIQFVMKDVMSDLLDEIYIALHSECPRIAAMGIRALIEHVIIDKVGDQGRFTDNLAEFEKKGFISSSEKAILDTALEVGHASIHRDHKPELDVLNSCLDIVEALINRLYLWPLQAESIKRTIPVRNRKRKANP
ncbi:MAG: DUF4145 domain-containing protein [Parvularcula sp.]|nr:DUF4145 domain-containing protein [Parvularcula sp.]